MTEYIALLRAINVGGHGKVGMAKLGRLATDLGFSHVRTFLQTGNLLLQANPRRTGTIEVELERAARDRLGLTTDIMVRTASEWAAALAGNPFEREAATDPAHLLVVFLKRPPAPGAERRLAAAIRGPERARVIGAEAYVVYPVGIGRSRLTLPVIETALGVKGTGRNWNTVTKLASLTSEKSTDGDDGTMAPGNDDRSRKGG